MTASYRSSLSPGCGPTGCLLRCLSWRLLSCRAWTTVSAQPDCLCSEIRPSAQPASQSTTISDCSFSWALCRGRTSPFQHFHSKMFSCGPRCRECRRSALKGWPGQRAKCHVLALSNHYSGSCCWLSTIRVASYLSNACSDYDWIAFNSSHDCHSRASESRSDHSGAICTPVSEVNSFYRLSISSWD